MNNQIDLIELNDSFQVLINQLINTNIFFNNFENIQKSLTDDDENIQKSLTNDDENIQNPINIENIIIFFDFLFTESINSILSQSFLIYSIKNLNSDDEN